MICITELMCFCRHFARIFLVIPYINVSPHVSYNYQRFYIVYFPIEMVCINNIMWSSRQDHSLDCSTGVYFTISSRFMLKVNYYFFFIQNRILWHNFSVVPFLMLSLKNRKIQWQWLYFNLAKLNTFWDWWIKWRGVHVNCPTLYQAKPFLFIFRFYFLLPFFIELYSQSWHNFTLFSFFLLLIFYVDY